MTLKRGRGATIGYMDQFDASHGLEQLTSHVRCRASVERSHADFAWICLGERNELGNRPGWEGRVDDHHERKSINPETG